MVESTDRYTLIQFDVDEKRHLLCALAALFGALGCASSPLNKPEPHTDPAPNRPEGKATPKTRALEMAPGLFGWPDGARVGVIVSSTGQREVSRRASSWDMKGAMLWRVQKVDLGFEVEALESARWEGALTPPDLSFPYLMSFLRVLRFSNKNKITAFDGVESVRSNVSAMTERFRGIPHSEKKRVDKLDDAGILRALQFVWDPTAKLIGRAIAPSDGAATATKRLPFPDFGEREADVHFLAEWETVPCPKASARTCRRIAETIRPDIAQTSQIYAETRIIDMRLKETGHHLIRKLVHEVWIDVLDRRLVGIAMSEGVDERNIGPADDVARNVRVHETRLDFVLEIPR